MGRRSHKYVQPAIPWLDGDFEYVSDSQKAELWQTARRNGWSNDGVKDAIAAVQNISFDSASVKVLLSKNFKAVLERLSEPAPPVKTDKQLKLL